MVLKVAIVGAGISGLATAKQCLAEGFSTTVFEARDHVGGQWYYEEPNPDAHSSIYKGTMTNTCRDTSSFSDFPMDPSRYPDYYGHELSLRYLDEYADHFGVGRHVRLNTRVISCTQLEDQRWEVAYATNGQEEPMQEVYDALFVCSGKNTEPIIPDFKGMDGFQGRILHSHLYREPDGFKGKKVAVVGFGNSAVDIAAEISEHAQECHLVTRRGGWVMPRFIFGKPVQAWDTRFSQSVVPASISRWTLTKLIEHVSGKLPTELQPEHSILGANPVMRSDFLGLVREGRIRAHRAGVQEVTQTGLRLTNGETLEVDAIILCTGYRIDYPVIPEKCYRSKTSDSPNAVHLYKLTVPPEHRNLFIIGVFQLPGPIQPGVELQARWATAVLTGRIKLPSTEKMTESIAAVEKRRAKEWVNSDRHTVSAHFLPFCDDLAADLDVAATFGRLVSHVFTSNPIRALSVLKAVYFGVFSSAQYRLFGEGSKPELAAATLMRVSRGDNELSERERMELGETAVAGK